MKILEKLKDIGEILEKVEDIEGILKILKDMGGNGRRRMNEEQEEYWRVYGV